MLLHKIRVVHLTTTFARKQGITMKGYLIKDGWAALSALEKIKGAEPKATPDIADPVAKQIILDSVADGVFTVDLDGNITSFNRAAEKITGVSRQEAMGKKCYEVFQADICENECALKQSMECGGEVIDCPVNIKNAQGKTVPISVSTAILRNELGNVVGGVESFRDVSGERSRRRIILNNIADGVFTVDNDRIITSFNRAAARITGVSSEAAVGKKCHEVFQADICEHDCALGKSMESGEEIIDCPVKIKNALGNTVPISVSTAILKDSTGKIVGGVESFRDLSCSETSHRRTILDSIADGVFTVDNDRIITSFNRAAARITGVSSEAAVGKKCHEVFQANICEHDCALGKSMENGEEIIDCPVKIKNALGNTVPISVSTAILKDSTGKIVGGVESFRDLSGSETILRSTILDSIADGVFTVDLAHHITSFNRAAEKITGVPYRQAIGKKCQEVFQADVCQGDCALGRGMENGEEVKDCRVQIKNADGHLVPISASSTNLQNDDGEVVGRVLTFRDLSTEELLRKEITAKYTFEDIISKSHELKKILDILPDIAESDSTVLIEGPSGSGKELFAKALHNLSKRSQGKFVGINCGALPDTLLESELFGYVKGAFTDAKRDKPGRFALAQGGTILLDEIGDISTALQIKLLRILQEKEYEPLGATYTLKTDARIIAATNRNLPELVARGQFREDLYYRLNVVKISLPPLAARREDIPLLIDHFIRIFNSKKEKDIQKLSDEAMAVLMAYDFPGNIRELENIIEYAFVLCRDGEIRPEHLPQDLVRRVAGVPQPASPAPKLNLIAQAEAEAIRQALMRNQGSKQKTALEMGLHKTTLWRKMKKLGID